MAAQRGQPQGQAQLGQATTLSHHRARSSTMATTRDFLGDAGSSTCPATRSSTSVGVRDSLNSAKLSQRRGPAWRFLDFERKRCVPPRCIEPRTETENDGSPCHRGAQSLELQSFEPQSLEQRDQRSRPQLARALRRLASTASAPREPPPAPLEMRDRPLAWPPCAPFPCHEACQALHRWLRCRESLLKALQPACHASDRH